MASNYTSMMHSLTCQVEDENDALSDSCWNFESPFQDQDESDFDMISKSCKPPALVEVVQRGSNAAEIRTESGHAHAVSSAASSLPRSLSSKASFPWKLHQILEQASVDWQMGAIVSWMPSGRAFRVHNSHAFVETIMPLYFKNQTNPKFKSFLRQLHLYNFRCIRKGPEKGAYTHDLFIRGKPDLCCNMVRTKIKKSKSTNDLPTGHTMNYSLMMTSPSIVSLDEDSVFAIRSSQNLPSLMSSLDSISKDALVCNQCRHPTKNIECLMKSERKDDDFRRVTMSLPVSALSLMGEQRSRMEEEEEEEEDPMDDDSLLNLGLFDLDDFLTIPVASNLTEEIVQVLDEAGGAKVQRHALFNPMSTFEFDTIFT